MFNIPTDFDPAAAPTDDVYIPTQEEADAAMADAQRMNENMRDHGTIN